MERKFPSLCIIIPCYNEEEVLPITAQIFLKKIYHLEKNRKISKNSRILFVNDGSTDNTWNIIKNLSKKNSKFYGISQSRNRGHQKALIAGYMETKDDYDITISIDSDGQDDVEAVDFMIDRYLDGFEIVYGIRKNRLTDTFFKKFFAEAFYKLMISMKIEIIYNHADYRLVSCKVLKELKKYEEVNVFLRGLFPLIGFKSTVVYYDRKIRIKGKSKYSLSKMLILAVDGITSLTAKPLHFIFISGILVFLSGILFLIHFLFIYLKRKDIDVPSTELYYISNLTISLILGGIQLISIGIIGEYIGKMYLEVKKRPRYIINERTDENKENKYINNRSV